MNGFHDTSGLLRQIEALSTATESIRRTQKALDCSPVLEGVRRAQEALDNSQLSESILRTQKALDCSPMLEGIRRAQEALDNSQLFESIRRTQKALDCSPMLEGIRRAQEALDNSQLFESIRRTQKALDCSPMLEGIRRAQEALDNSQLFESIRRTQKALDCSPMLEGIRRTQAALDNSSLALHRVVRQMAKANALDFRVGHTGNRLATHVTEVAVTREKAQGRDLRGRRLGEFGQTATNWLVRLASRRRVRRPVGSSLRGVAEFVVSKKSYEQIYDPLISDLRLEYFEALAANRRWKARWVRARGYGSFLTAGLAHAAASGGHHVVRVCRIFWAAG